MSLSSSRLRSRRYLLAGALALAAVAGAITIAVSAAEDKWWLDYAGGPASSRYFPSKVLNKSNVAKLAVAWTYPYGETGFNPIVAHGAIYGRGRNGAIIALDAKTGKELWIHDGMQAMTARGMNYWASKDGKDRRLIFSMNDYLQEIDAATGLSIPTFGTNGVVDLRDGLGRDPASLGRIQSGTPGKVFENLVLLGSATGEGYLSPPGDLRAYDVLSGKLVWQFHTVPHPGEFGYETWPKDAWKYIGGTNTWGELTVDVQRGIAYFPTASPTYDYYGADRPGANLFANCLLALDARTGKRLWHFQNVHHDLWDFDNNAAPQLTTIKRDGKNIDVVAMAGKTGFLYVFDRVSGAPIWPIEERPVPKSEMPGEQSWPTQPFPTNPPPFSRQSFTLDDINPHPIVTNEAREAFRARITKARNMGLFTPIDFIDTLHIPGSNGGALFGYTAAEPTTGNVYVISQDNPGLLRLVKPGEGGTGGPPGQSVYQRECSVCHGFDRSGTQNGPTLLTVPGRLDAATIRSTVANGKGRMPAFPHISDVDMEVLATYLVTGPAGGRGRGGPVPTFPPGPVVATGSAVPRPLPAGGGRGRGGPRPYPEGVEQTPQYVINEYGTIGTMMKPPFTSLVKYDLNSGRITWKIGLGDDARLAALGITGTGVTQMRSSLIVTEGGLIFAPGGDSKIRAFDAETGATLWTSPLGGNIRGGPSMYEIDGRQYLLVPASGDIPAAGLPPDGKAPAGAPVGYVAYALPDGSKPKS
jgi:quinoprotein glucose dehydrogenase